MELRDLIYFDFDKAASIYSQIEGGLLKETQESSEDAADIKKGIKLNLQVLKPELSKNSIERTSTLESKELHHDLLVRLEMALFEMGLLLDLNQEASKAELSYSDSELHELVSKPSFILANGWASIEDYNRFDFFTTNFKEIMRFIQKCQVQGIEQSEEYGRLMQSIENIKVDIKNEKNGQRKAQMRFQVKNLEQTIGELLKPETSLERDLPDWLLEGINMFVKTLMPNRINLRLHPFEENADFEVLSNLKSECFFDADLENVSFAYGTRPNVQLTILGLITSIPNKGNTVFDPMKLKEESGARSEDDSSESFETGFRQIFRSYEEFERFVRFSRYPNFTVYPIAVYQRLGKVKTEQS